MNGNYTIPSQTNGQYRCLAINIYGVAVMRQDIMIKIMTKMVPLSRKNNVVDHSTALLQLR